MKLTLGIQLVLGYIGRAGLVPPAPTNVRVLESGSPDYRVTELGGTNYRITE